MKAKPQPPLAQPPTAKIAAGPARHPGTGRFVAHLRAAPTPAAQVRDQQCGDGRANIT